MSIITFNTNKNEFTEAASRGLQMALMKMGLSQPPIETGAWLIPRYEPIMKTGACCAIALRGAELSDEIIVVSVRDDEGVVVFDVAGVWKLDGSDPESAIVEANTEGMKCVIRTFIEILEGGATNMILNARGKGGPIAKG